MLDACWLGCWCLVQPRSSSPASPFYGDGDGEVEDGARGFYSPVVRRMGLRKSRFHHSSRGLDSSLIILLSRIVYTFAFEADCPAHLSTQLTIYHVCTYIHTKLNLGTRNDSIRAATTRKITLVFDIPSLSLSPLTLPKCTSQPQLSSSPSSHPPRSPLLFNHTILNHPLHTSTTPASQLASSTSTPPSLPLHFPPAVEARL